MVSSASTLSGVGSCRSVSGSHHMGHWDSSRHFVAEEHFVVATGGTDSDHMELQVVVENSVVSFS